MKNKKLLVSIIVPTKNSEQTLNACIKSIKQQTYKNIEIIVVDNNSTDKTKETAKEYTKLVFNKGPERSAQRNLGAAKSSGDYLLFIDSDMELSKKVVEECIDKFKIKKSKSKLGSVIIPEESFGEGFWAQCIKLERSFYVGVDWMEAARFFSRKAFNKSGGFDEKLISGEDWDINQRVLDNFAIERINAKIMHNEGKLSLFSLLIKKFYYAKNVGKYAQKKENYHQFNKQANILNRYRLFFSNPSKLFGNPSVGIGMLFMKTLEFFVGGVGYLL